MKEQTFVAPEGFDAPGISVGGGWFPVTDGKLVVPAEGNYSSLQGLGFTPVPTPAASPVAVDAASDKLASRKPKAE